VRDELKIGSAAAPTEPLRGPAAVDETALLRRVAVGDRGAFDQLYRAYYPRLFSYLFRIVRRLDVVEETLNDHARQGWSFVEMERAHRGASLFFLLVFRKD